MAICKAWKYLTKLANVLMKEISKARIITNFMEEVWWNTLSNNKYLIWKELLRYEVFSTLLYSISLVKNLASPSRDFAAAQSGLRSTLLNDQQNIKQRKATFLWKHSTKINTLCLRNEEWKFLLLCPIAS